MSHASPLIATDIEGYLRQHERKGLLRFITCGSVDDGKSTLIGRMLYESKLIFDDQLAALQGDSRKWGTQGEDLDLALLVDGLAAEREQGITIDVAYRFFSTENRKFIVADTPGHEQYTRNMATGASTADLAVIVIDARAQAMSLARSRFDMPRASNERTSRSSETDGSPASILATRDWLERRARARSACVSRRRSRRSRKPCESRTRNST